MEQAKENHEANEAARRKLALRYKTVVDPVKAKAERRRNRKAQRKARRRQR